VEGVPRRARRAARRRGRACMRTSCTRMSRVCTNSCTRLRRTASYAGCTRRCGPRSGDAGPQAVVALAPARVSRGCAVMRTHGLGASAWLVRLCAPPRLGRLLPPRLRRLGSRRRDVARVLAGAHRRHTDDARLTPWARAARRAEGGARGRGGGVGCGDMRTHG
jgi:hypothetical protein